MIIHKAILVFLLSFADEVTCSKKSSKKSKSLEEGKAAIEAWSTWIHGSSSMSLPVKSPVQKPAKPAKPSSPTPKPTPCIGTPEELLNILSKVSTRADLLKSGTPQNDAYNWLLKDNFYCYSDPKIIQRYIMALTYFSTDGEKWTNCGQEGGSSACDPLICNRNGGKPRLGTKRWLDKGSECTWCGAACNTTNKCITDIDLDSVNVGGSIPYELQNLTILEVLALQRGFIKGTIPSTLGNLKHLKNLDLNFNNITGSVPENLYNAKTLEQLDLNDNELSGTVSPKISDLKNLFYWQLGNDSPWGKNSFKGTIPPGVSGLNDLQVVALNNVDFEGTLPTLSDNKVLNFLDVSENKFSGPIDNTNWGNKPNLEYADFSNNKFSGSIPSGFGNAKDLVLASFDTNDFTGSMPSQICDLRSGSLKNLTSDCAGATPEVTCAFPTCCTGCF